MGKSRKDIDLSIDGIIDTCEGKAGLDLTGLDRRDCGTYLDWFLAKHPEYDLAYLNPDAAYHKYPYFYAAADSLQVFLYLDGKLEIVAGKKGEEEVRRILSLDDLWMLKRCEIGIGSGISPEVVQSFKTDRVLLKLVRRIDGRSIKWCLPNWGQHIDKTGNFPLVVEHLGQAVDNKLVKLTPSPNDRHLLRGRSFAE